MKTCDRNLLVVVTLMFQSRPKQSYSQRDKIFLYEVKINLILTVELIKLQLPLETVVLICSTENNTNHILAIVPGVDCLLFSGDDAISQLEDQQDCDGEICEEEDDVGEENQQEDGEDAGAGWAEAMAKILGKETTVSNSSILLKNKELQKIKAAEREEQLIRKKQVCWTVRRPSLTG